MTDVLQTAAVFLRFELVRGRLSREACQAALRGLVEAAEAEPRVSAISQAWNKARLLLEEGP
jgi:hypothetical protein